MMKSKVRALRFNTVCQGHTKGRLGNSAGRPAAMMIHELLLLLYLFISEADFLKPG